MTKLEIFLAAVLCAASVHAWAQAPNPVLSGQYSLNFTYTCPAYLQQVIDQQNPNDLSTILTVYPGASSSVFGVATFNSAKQTVSFNGYQSGTGGLVYIAGNGSNPPSSYHSPITATNHGFTVGPNNIFLDFLGTNSPSYDAIFINNGKQGVVRSATFGDRFPGPGELNCISAGTLTR